MLLLILRAIFSSIKSRRSLALENLALRHQLDVLQRTRKPRHLTNRDRVLWIVLSRLWPDWRESLAIVQPKTVVAWHRKGWRLYWRWKCRGRGRPVVPVEVRCLIRRISRENPLWGAPRIHGELLKLGIDVSEATVAKYIIKRRRPPSPTWRSFIHNHFSEIVAVDFFTVPTLTFKTLYVFVVLSLDRRRVLHFNVTDSPTAEWTSRQIVQAFPFDTASRFLLRDRDKIYGEKVVDTLRSIGIEQVVTARKSPWQNGYVERVIGSARRECLDHVIVLNHRHLRRILKEYFQYYHEARTHLGLGKDSPVPREVELPGAGTVVAEPMVGGLHHRYYRKAA
ncbi:MAG: integrase core domain-containing protein [Candidatus Krumholzibacteria bacterium]